jgi:DUF1680 family protein
MILTRRRFLASTSMLALAPAFAPAAAAAAARRVEPVPARYVALKPSIFADAMAANRRYLLHLDPERLLHNFYISAGLTPRGDMYGGWEAQGIAGHTLGHWLTAASLTVANTGDAQLSAALDRTLAAMARVQAAEGDGYLGGITAPRGGKTVPGKIIFEEVRRGDIRTDWTLNQGWVPIYAQHKVLAGLIDAHQLAGKRVALPIATGLAGYMGGVFDALSEAQMQQVLSVEHGGILESYAELHAITGDQHWLSLAGRLRHRAVFEPLAAGQDKLAGLHANTQIPKLVGHARLHEVAGDPADAKAALFFHDTVRRHHSYAIGGNSEREHFGKPDRQGEQLTTATCEACNSYNMLKLTRHLYAWQPRGDWFDYYERTQLNHIMAHQRPDTGQFVYFMPMEAGAKREFSKPVDSFWCCVGSGMESHAKHADSIYWQSADTLFVNLFIPSTLDVPGGARLDLDTRYPQDGGVRLTLARPPAAGQAIAVRRPAWAEGARLLINGQPITDAPRDGYWRVARRWRAGDRIEVTLPMTLRAEPLAGAPSTYAFLSGPLVLAADLGAATRPFDDPAPALLAAGMPEAALTPIAGGAHRYRITDVLGHQREVTPFFPMYDRRTAVYFRTFTPDSWAASRVAYLAAEAERADLVRRTIDIFHIGEQQPEVDHALVATSGRAGEFYGRHNRDIPQGSAIRFSLARRRGPALLQLTYWGRDTGRTIAIEVDGQLVATETRQQPSAEEWVVVDYPLPLTSAATSIVKLTARKGDAVIYGVRSLQPAGAEATRA